MLPYVHPAYWNGERRLFYIGKDTFGWNLGGGGFADFFDTCDQGDFAGYLAKNDAALPLGKESDQLDERDRFVQARSAYGEKYSLWSAVPPRNASRSARNGSE